MLVFVKTNALYVIYVIGLVLYILALTGKVRWPILFVVGLIPLRNVVDRIQQLPLGRDFLDILLVILIIGWIIAGMNRRKILEKSPINIWAMVMVGYMFFTLINGSHYLGFNNILDVQDPRVQDWKNFAVLPLLFFLTFNNIREKKWVWYTIGVMCLTMLLMDYYVLQQIKWYSNIISRKKISGTFVFLGPNEVAAFYNQYTIILICLFFAIRKRAVKWALLGLIVLNVTCVTFLFSRAAYLGLAMGLLLIFLFRCRVMLIPIFLVALFWQSVLPAKVLERISMTTNYYGELDESALGRIEVWKTSWELFQQNPVTGVGFGVFRFLGFELGDTHNIYLKILVEQGVIGLTIFLLLVLCFFFQGVKLARNGDDELSKGLGLGFAICIVILLINNIFGDRWSYMELSSNLWVFAGLVARLNIFADEKRREAQKQKVAAKAKKYYGDKKQN
jgi:O-antigen ligase